MTLAGAQSIAIVGSRDYRHLTLVRDVVNSLPQNTTVISGGARGVDRMAERAAAERGLQTRIFPADWNKHGRKAGILRNRDMIMSADMVIAFWDGQSRGTVNSMELASKYGKPLVVYGNDGARISFSMG